MWRDLSIAKKLYLVVGIMATLIAVELVTLRFSLRQLSALRAFVEGEALWSKAQKDATFCLERYTVTHDEKDYQAFLADLEIPAGDHQARIELQKPRPDLAVVREGFLRGHNAPSDVGPMIDLLQRFYWISYIHRAIGHWTRGDQLLGELEDAGARIHGALTATPPDLPAAQQAAGRILLINGELTAEEQGFSRALGEGSRWLEHVVNTVLFIAVLMVECVGLTLTIRTTRRITRGLSSLNAAASRIGRGDFGEVIEVQSRDEIGTLAQAVKQMDQLLKRSYEDLEQRVRERTAELEKMAAENAHLYEQSQAALRTRDEFVSIASHELRSPLNAVVLQLEVLARRSARGSEKEAEGLKKALGHVHRLSSLVEDLLNLARIRAGKLDLHAQACDLAVIVQDSVAQLSAAASASGSAISLHAEAPVVGHVDPTRLGQVVTNLISNAIKYGEGRPIDVTLRALDGAAEIAVEDHGMGIAPEKQEKIFERFERAVDDPGISGLGLGLYITKQIVEAHHGSISVESRPGQGARFTVRMPLGEGP